MVRSHLEENGVMIVNMNMISDREDGINAYLQDTIASVFGHVYTVNVQNASNRELFASDNPEIAALLERNAAETGDAQLREMMQNVSGALVPYQSGGRLLTDDKAPVELLGMQTIDDMISRELGYYKKKLEEKGIAGLIG